MTAEEQLEKWVKGESLHNDERDECCPDFSCCGSPISPKNVRKKFAKAWAKKDQETINSMLLMFLGNIVPDNVHVAGNKQITSH